MFVLHLLVLPDSCVSITLKFTVIMFGMMMSGMPNKACPFPETAKNLQILYLLLC